VPAAAQEVVQEEEDPAMIAELMAQSQQLRAQRQEHLIMVDPGISRKRSSHGAHNRERSNNTAER
jgi:hypothetical protein